MSWSESVLLRRAAHGAAMLGLVALAGCGFHLRGSTDLAFARIAVQGVGTALLPALKRQIRATTSTQVVDDPKQAQAVLTVLQDQISQTATAYNADGTVAQYELRETASYRVDSPGGAVLIAPTTVTQTTRLSYSTGATLAKANEADLLYKGMRQGLVERMMFQLAALAPPAPASAPRTAP